MSTTNSTGSDTRLYLRLLSYVRVYWKVFSVAIIAMIILALTSPAIAALFKTITAGLFLQQDADLTRLIVIPVLVLFTIAGVASYVSKFAINWVANRVIMDLRVLMFQRLLEIPNATLDQYNAGTLTSKFTFDVTQLKEASTNALTTAVKDSLTILGLLGWMLYLNWAMTMVALLAGPLISVVLLIIRKRLRKMSKLVQDSMADIHHLLDEAIRGHSIIKIFGGKQQELQQFSKAANKNRLQNMKFIIAAAASAPTIQIITAFALAAIIYVAAVNASSGAMAVDEFNSFFAAVLMILNPIKRLSRINEHMQRGLAACESVFGFLDQQVEEDRDATNSTPASGSIQFKQITFHYDTQENAVLSGIDLTVAAGSTIAIVGPSGAGKTSLAGLLPRLYESNSGQILIDDIDIRDMSLTQLRDNIAYVSQDIMLFNDTIRNNIAYGDAADASEEEIVAAATNANAMEFISALPEGLATPVGSGGSRLSGGQQQRIALARAFLKNAPILILDEATSSLDTESERLIQQAMETLTKDRTCIIIAHRLSTVEAADRIVVLEEGRIVETGTHADLLNQNGLYARLHVTTNQN